MPPMFATNDSDPVLASDDASATDTIGRATSPYHSLRVAEVINETKDAISILFDEPEQAGLFAYSPGQFLTLRLDVDGVTLARCYSLASAPGIDPRLKVTVKRVVDGRASNRLCDSVKVGDHLEVMPPAGVFTPRSLDTDMLLIAGGSGITPVISILKAVLRRGRGRVTLFYANRDEASVIFRDELRALMREYPERMRILHWLESVQGVPAGEVIAAMLSPRPDQDAFICGPEPFMDCVVAALSGAGMERARIHVERFVSLAGDPGAATPAGSDEEGDSAEANAAEVLVTLDGQTATLRWPANRMLLDVLLQAGMNASFSCREGRCSACACKLLAGEARMIANAVLEQADMEEGWLLSCQARPVSDRVEVSFDA